jgi:hypothetical protein
MASGGKPETLMPRMNPVDGDGPGAGLSPPRSPSARRSGRGPGLPPQVCLAPGARPAWHSAMTMAQRIMTAA